MDCPITHEPYEDPVLVPCCGNSFDRLPLSSWLERHWTCPMCRHPMPEFEPMTSPTNITLLCLIKSTPKQPMYVCKPQSTSPQEWIPANQYTKRLKLMLTDKK